MGNGSRRREAPRATALDASRPTSSIRSRSPEVRASLAARRFASVASSGIELGAARRAAFGRRCGEAASTASRQARDAPTTRRPVAAPTPRRATPPQFRGVSSAGPSAQPSSVVERRVARSSAPRRARGLGAERPRSPLGVDRPERGEPSRSVDRDRPPSRSVDRDRLLAPPRPDAVERPPLPARGALEALAPDRGPPVLPDGRPPPRAAPRGPPDFPERDEPEEEELAIGQT